MTDEQVGRLANLALAYIRTHPDTPYDTGNLKFKSLNVRKVAPYQYEIYIELDIAPYQVYLNERERTRGGHSNRHYQWWEAMRVRVAEYLAELIGDGFDEARIKSEENILADKLAKMNGGKT